MTSRKRTSKDYPAEFLETWELAAKGTLRIVFDTKGQAINFRQRLHAFRRAIIDENTQAPFQHWFLNDLVVEEDFNQKVWILKTAELDWKAQVRAQAAKEQIATPTLPSSRIDHPASTLPPGLGPEPPEMGGHTTTALEPKVKEAMESALSKLGFGSKQ